ncbi:MAG: hypothetical protein U0704_10860 [Candidatus Eisenbacteria bacterium]
MLGQPDFVTNSAGVTQSKFSTTRFVCTDANGRLFVVEEANNRIMVFENAAALANGAPANYVIGQSNFTTGSAVLPPTAASLSTPRALVMDEPNGRMWVADWANNRVLRYQIAAGVGTTLTLAGPNGGENWTYGTVHGIAWSSANVANVNLDYSTDDGATWTSIATNVPANQFSYAWTVPATPTTTARVRVTDSSNPALSDQSDAAFTISAPVPTVQLVSPNGLQQWPAGATRNILFQAANFANARLEVSSDAGATWSEIVASTNAAAGSYAWTVPATLGTDYRIRVSNTADPLVADVSDQSFAVSEPLVELRSTRSSSATARPRPTTTPASPRPPHPRCSRRRIRTRPPFRRAIRSSAITPCAWRGLRPPAAAGQLANAGVGWPGQDVTTRDNLLFHVFSESALPQAALPCIYLEDLGNRKTTKLPLANWLTGVSAGAWQRVAIPVQAFRDAPGTADLTAIKTVFLAQQNADGVARVLATWTTSG